MRDNVNRKEKEDSVNCSVVSDTATVTLSSLTVAAGCYAIFYTFF